MMEARSGCLALCVVSSVVYIGFMAVPPLRNKALVQSAVAASSKRYQERQLLIKDPKTNGFLTPALLPLWDGTRKGTAIDAVAGWSSGYSSIGTDRWIQHVVLLKAKDSAYLQSRKRFAALLPKISQAFAKPVFKQVNAPLKRPSAAASQADVPALKLLLYALSGLAESLVAENRLPEVVPIYQTMFRMGPLVGDDDVSLVAMTGISLQALAFQSFVATIHPSHPLTAQEWTALSRTISESAPGEQFWSETTENDTVQGLDFLDQPRSSFGGDTSSLGSLYLLPGFRARDKRIFSNAMAVALDQARLGDVRESPGTEGFLGFLLGREGPGPKQLIPDYSAASARVRIHAVRMRALAAVTGVAAYRAKNGRLPQHLSDLDTLALKAPGGVPWSKDTGTDYIVSGAGAIVGVKVSKELFARAGVDLAQLARLESVNSVYFKVSENGFFFQF